MYRGRSNMSVTVVSRIFCVLSVYTEGEDGPTLNVTLTLKMYT